MTQLPVFYTFIIVHVRVCVFGFFYDCYIILFIFIFYLANLPYKNFSKKRFYAMYVEILL